MDTLKRLSEITELANITWKSPDDAREFMHTPIPELGGKSPYDAAQDQEGAAQVRSLLTKMRRRLLSLE